MIQTISVLLADDHQIVRDGLRAILESADGVCVIGETSAGHDTIAAAEALRPDVIVMDIEMPDLNGIDTTHRIMDRGIPCRVIALSRHATPQFVKGMLKAGAVGFLPKRCAATELILAIRSVINGEFYVSTSVAAGIVTDYVAYLEGKGSERDLLSVREREVLQLISEGKTTPEIAAFLKVSAKTIETHRKRIMDKLDIRTIAGLTKYAVRLGITSLGE